MTTENGTRVYGSARDLIRIYRLDPDRITGTGKEGAITKGDTVEFLRGEQEEAPSQASMILRGVAEGLSNPEIAARIKEVNPDSGIQPGHVPNQLAKERNRGSDWWEDPDVQEALGRFRPGLKGVEPAEEAELDVAAASQPEASS